MNRRLPRTPLVRWLNKLPSKTWSRRDFLKISAQGAVSLAAITNFPACTKRRGLLHAAPPLQSRDPIAIIGGGVAGLTLAYRLRQRGIASEIFEADSTRLGGRIHTSWNFNAAGQFVELGAEFVDTSHRDLRQLAEELEMDVVSIIDDDKGLENFVFAYHGQLYREKDILNALPSFLAYMEEDQADLVTPGDEEWTEKAFRLDRTSLKDYLSRLKGVDAWLRELFEVAYVNEFGLDAVQQSALNLLTCYNPKYVDEFHPFGDSDESWRIRGGNSRLTGKLAEVLERHGVSIHLGHALTRIQQKSGGELTLDFARSHGSTHTGSYSQVVLALPYSVLRKVEGVQALSLSPIKKRAIQSLGYGTNRKWMLGFKDRPWRTRDKMAGNFVTSARSQQFWETSRGQPGEAGIMTNFLGGSNGISGKKFLLDQALKDLSEFSSATAAAHTGEKISWPWPEHLLSQGSYSCAKVGQLTTIFDDLGKTELSGRLQFIGEHVSENSQGFMNGAIESANRAADEIAGKFREFRKSGT